MEFKEKGNSYFVENKLAEAIEEYSKGLDSLTGDDEGNKSLKVVLYQNRAACYLKMDDFEKVIVDCTNALELERTSAKGLFRRAQGYLGLNQVENAFQDLKLLVSIDKNNHAAINLIQKVKNLIMENNSLSAQTLKYIDAIVEECSKSELDRSVVDTKLKQVFGSILDDEQLACSIIHKDNVIAKLWNIKEIDSIACKILSKMAEYPTCLPKLLVDIDMSQVGDVILKEEEKTNDDENDDSLEDCKSSCLNIAWRLFKFQQELIEKKKFTGATPKIENKPIVSYIVYALASDNEALRRTSIEAAVRVCGGEDKEMASLFVDLKGMEALMSLLNRDLNRNEPLQQVSVVLGQVLPTLNDDDRIKKNALAFCKPCLTSDDVFDQIRGAIALDAIFFANRELGFALVKEDGLLEPLKKIARIGSERAQAVTAEIFSHIAHTEPGRALLAGEITETLQLLVTSDSKAVKSSAAVTLAKLNAVDFEAESEQGMLVLSSVVHLLANEASKEEHAKGVEAISFVITDSQVKNMICQKGEGLKVLKELISLATKDKKVAKEAYAYGLSFVFENLTLSIDDKRREKLREMEVTEEQWEQFEKLTKSQTRKPGQIDPREQVEFRIMTLVQNDAIQALNALVLNGGSERVCESIARAFVNIATVKEVRGQMLAQGCLKPLFQLTSMENSKIKGMAAHALAKIFVTTDPHVLKDAQLMDTIGPLVRQVRQSDLDLCVFECCMALTNIATVSFEAKQKLVNSKAIQAFEYAQYSENNMVRRAATEAINNLIPTEEVIEWICSPQKMKLWLLFAQAFDEDLPTSCAATGALANIAADERVAEALQKQEENALEKIVGLAKCGIIDIEHRATVCLLCLIESWPEGKGKQAITDAGGKKAMEYIVKTHPNSPAAQVANECLSLLK